MIRFLNLKSKVFSGETASKMLIARNVTTNQFVPIILPAIEIGVPPFRRGDFKDFDKIKKIPKDAK